MEVDICVGVVSRWSQMGASHDGAEYMSTLNTRTLKTRGRMICLFCRQGGGFQEVCRKKNLWALFVVYSHVDSVQKKVETRAAGNTRQQRENSRSNHKNRIDV